MAKRTSGRPIPILIALAVLAVGAGRAPADEPAFERKGDVIYGRKFGTALTLDVFTPKSGANGAAVVWVVSGGWFSSPANIRPAVYAEFLKRGYTVFAVVHGSQPRFSIVDAIADVRRAIRFIRHNAAEFRIDPDRIGISGGSAGGHLSLMAGTTGDDVTKGDAVDAVSCRVQAVGCFYPPTDFLNWGEKGKNGVNIAVARGLRGPFDFQEYDAKTRSFLPVTDEKAVAEIARKISPIYSVTADDAPTLIIHGDSDPIVPLQQSESFIAELKKANVPAELVVKKGAAHGWSSLPADVGLIADWFDRHLKKPGEK